MAVQQTKPFEPRLGSGSVEVHTDYSYGLSAPTWDTVQWPGSDFSRWVLQVEQALGALRDEVANIRERLEGTPLLVSAIQIRDLATPEYSLRAPISVLLEEYTDEVIARLPEFDLYASGPSHAIALANLKAEILSTYQRLVELGQDRLGPIALQWLQTMNLIIERRSDAQA